MYVTFILPESLDSEEKERLRTGLEARMKKRMDGPARVITETFRPPYSRHPVLQLRWLKRIFRFLGPLAVLAPKKTNNLGSDGSVCIRPKPFWRWDWDLTLVGLALWCGYLSMVHIWHICSLQLVHSRDKWARRVSTRINTYSQSMSMIGRRSRCASFLFRLTVNLPASKI